MNVEQEISTLAEEIKGSQKILTALGDEMRQHLILVMMQSGECSGMRVNQSTQSSIQERKAWSC